MSNEVKLSVRSLVEYVYRSGSIDSKFRTSSTLTEGAKAHVKIQKTYKDSDQKEMYLTTSIEYGDLVFLIDGRCDGLIVESNEFTIDEIKSTSRDLSLVDEETYPVHWAQAKCYAYMYARDEELDRMNVQLTYVHVITEEKKQFKISFTYEELEAFVLEVVKSYAPYASLRHVHKIERDASINRLEFPFPTYREGQRKFAGAVYKTISDRKNLFAQASTGTGKTISTIFPAAKAMGEGLLQRMFYLTAKTITRQAAEEAFSLMKNNGLCMNTVTITAKDKICFKDKTLCQKEHCEFADGYYDRVNEAVLDILSNESLMDREVIERYARKHTVCPFEFSLDLAYAADAVICDYNYVFDPRVSLKRLFDEEKKQTALLVDEAHNLVDRAREMFSADLNKWDFLQLQRDFKNKSQSIYESAKAINDYLLDLKKQCGEKRNMVFKELEEELVTLLETFSLHAEGELTGEDNQLLLDTYFSAQSFIRIAKLYDQRYVTFVEYERSNVWIRMFCIDPSYLLRQTGKKYRSTVYFSATLTPLDYYNDMLGGQPEDYRIRVKSPFAREHAKVFIQPLSTRYRDRERTKAPMTAMIYDRIKNNPGNYLVFFPSYQYMLAVYEQFVEEHPSVNTMIQDRRMTEFEREEFLEAFQAGNEETLLGFAVLGGIFSEGVDLKGDRLSGVIVVGVGLPRLSLERDMIKDYFNDIGKNGYNYAYVFPGMNKVLQAGGRLIRSEEDRGVIMLVDDRFLNKNYQSLLPYEWQDYEVVR